MANIAAAPVGVEDTFEYQRCGMHVRAAFFLTYSSPSASQNYRTTIRHSFGGALGRARPREEL